MKTLEGIKQEVSEKNGYKSFQSLLWSGQVSVEDIERIVEEIAREYTINVLNAMMPEEVDIVERFEGLNIVDAIEFGMKKQQLMEREIYLKNIEVIQAKS